MAIFNFVKPDKIVLQKANDFEAQFEFRPLEPGYGVTIGNAFRQKEPLALRSDTEEQE